MVFNQLKLVLFVNFNLSHFKSKEEVMAVRLREADRIAAVAELQQHIAELEIQVISDDIKCDWILYFLYFFLLPLPFLFNLLCIQGIALLSGIILSC